MNATSAQAQAQAEAAAVIVQGIIRTLPQTEGAALAGSYLSAIIYGVTLLQTYQYFSRYYGRDNIYLYSLIILITVLDTFAVILNMSSTWFYLIRNFANPLAILSVDWTFAFSIIVSEVVAFIIQSFYAYRAYILSGRKIWIPVIILIFSLVGLILGIIYVAFLFEAGSIFAIAAKAPLSTASFSSLLVADAFITGSITWYLLRGRHKGFRRSDTLIRKLVVYTINTGVVSTVFTVITLVLGEAQKSTFYNIIFYLLLSRCYVNSMLAFLNARDALRDADTNMVSFQVTTPKLGATLNSTTTSNSVEKPLSNRRGSLSTTVFNNKSEPPSSTVTSTLNDNRSFEVTTTTHDDFSK